MEPLKPIIVHVLLTILTKVSAVQISQASAGETIHVVRARASVLTRIAGTLVDVCRNEGGVSRGEVG